MSEEAWFYFLQKHCDSLEKILTADGLSLASM